MPLVAPADAARKAAGRAAARDLVIPRIKSPPRRRRCLEDPPRFLRTYFPEVFYQEFTPVRLRMVETILHAARYGGDQAIAGPRGDGKTRTALFIALLLLLRGEVSFPLIVSKSGPRANRELRNLKEAIRDSETFAEDFPEISVPVRALAGWASRARQQTACGESTRLEWGEECLVFPTIPTKLLRAHGWSRTLPSAATGQILASLGIEGPIRGYSVRNRRPDLAILDDIDDRESAHSEKQTETRERIIEEDIGGLAGPDKTVARVMLCTLLNHTCNAAVFTDRRAKPSWRGDRYKLLEQKPAREDLWQDYIALRNGRGETDPDARDAWRFYAENRDDMDAGAVVSNPFRFDSRPLEDGRPNELSALQMCYNLIADRGWDHFATEYQNDPPEELKPIESGITPHRVQRQLSGYQRRQIPPGCVLLTQGIDVSKKALHYVIRAWRPDCTAWTVDYGVHEVLGTTYGSDEGLDQALRRAILARMEITKALDFVDHMGSPATLAVDLTLIDASWRTDAIYASTLEAGVGCSPIMGFGKSAGCVQANFHDVQKRSTDRRPGDGWFLSRKGRVWLVCADADRWKAFEHDRWMTEPGGPGSMQLWGEGGQPGGRLSSDERDHHSYAHHICSEVEIEEPIKGTLRRRWKVKSENNHFLDASVYASVAASMRGIRLDMAAVARATKRIPGESPPAAAAGEGPPKRKTLAEMARR